MLKFNNIDSIHSFVKSFHSYYFWVYILIYLIVAKGSYYRSYLYLYISIYLFYPYIVLITSSILIVFFIKLFLKRKKKHIWLLTPVIYLFYLKLNTTTYIANLGSFNIFYFYRASCSYTNYIFSSSEHYWANSSLQMKFLTKPSLLYNNYISLQYNQYILL